MATLKSLKITITKVPTYKMRQQNTSQKNTRKSRISHNISGKTANFFQVYRKIRKSRISGSSPVDIDGGYPLYPLEKNYFANLNVAP